ncbi:hypothetical protein VCRA2120O333_10220 [Vibrio crassostreae]|nr:hypothetical protein VCRA2113O324_20146 [Vibrio crassostreae]CAK1989678.1 hypothetical protein VCRA2113O322_20288 [Vibrio crassostreae]CAK2182194.1 hypothetical protein VCRA2113O326_60221 [Vibrio crassostreae]CAK2473809.1 hypothetical protein VCRA2114E327_30219 [Vibrio crassostreae]CAK2874997.1 hypothetical protein VCRA2113O323_30311 [Vibrio crassostreae]
MQDFIFRRKSNFSDKKTGAIGSRFLTYFNSRLSLLRAIAS